SRVHVNTAVALTRDRARDVVANSKRAIAFAFAFAQSAKRVGGFAALADREDKRVLGRRRVSMTVLTGKIDIDRNVCQLLDDVFANTRGVQGGAATGKNNTRDVAQFGRIHVQAAKLCG